MSDSREAHELAAAIEAEGLGVAKVYEPTRRGRCELMLDGIVPARNERELRGCAREVVLEGMSASAPKWVVYGGAALFAAGLIGFIINKMRNKIPGAGATLPVQDIGPVAGAYVALANKWGAAYGVPPSWVVATIINESQGRPAIIGDQGRSVGLMQVNTQAQASRMAKYGVDYEGLKVPDNNIHLGTEILREAYDNVVKWLAGRTPPEPIDVITRLAYRGPGLVKSALQSGRVPSQVFDANSQGGTTSAVAWRSALQQASAVV